MICGNEGAMVFYNMKDQTEIWASDPDKLPIEDAQWNPAEDYLIVGYRDGTIKLFEGEKGTESVVFERQGTGNIFL